MDTVRQKDIESVAEKVKRAGVVGAGGAGFPTYAKFGGGIDTVIVNGAECEPLLEVDIHLMRRQATRLLAGLDAVTRAMGAKIGVLAIKGKHRQLISQYRQLIGGEGRLRVRALGDFYPVGDEQSLVLEVTGNVVPEGGIPLATKAVVFNVETMLNVEAAVNRDAPVTQSTVSICGAVAAPYTMTVPVGTSVQDLVSVAGGAMVSGYRLILGGPMTGTLLPEQPASPAVVSKTTKGIIVLPRNHYLVQCRERSLTALLGQAISACCQCRLCTDLCPRYLLGHSLEPHRVLNAVNYGTVWDTTAITQALLCCECGLCDLYVCPLGLSPRRIFQQIKMELKARGVKNPHALAPTAVRTQRAGRRVPSNRLVEHIGLVDYAGESSWLESTFQPSQVWVPLNAHIGAPAQPVVKVGDTVKTGDLLGIAPSGKLGAWVHASIDGVVEKITDSHVRIGGLSDGTK